MNFIDRIRRRKWRIIIRSRITGKPVVNKSISKADAFGWWTAPSVLSTEIFKPSRRFARVKPHDQLELYRVGVLVASLPIRVITWQQREQKLTLRAERAPW